MEKTGDLPEKKKTASLYKCTVYCVYVQLSCTQTVYTCIYIYLMFIVKKGRKKGKNRPCFQLYLHYRYAV